MRQASTTSLGDDARETLTITGLEKATERSLEQHLRLRAPQTWAVLCNSVDHCTCEGLWIQLLLNRRPWKLELSCQRVLAAAKLDMTSRMCCLRNAKCSNWCRTGHLKKVCREREKSSGKEGSASSSSKGSGKGGKKHRNNETCYCCGLPRQRRPDCPHRNERCSRCGKRGHLSQICQSEQNANARAVKLEPDVPDETLYKEIQSVFALSVCSTPGSQTRDSGSEFLHMIMGSRGEEHVIPSR